MFRRILVPVDDTRRAVEAVDLARRLAERLRAEVVLLRVEETVVDMREVTQAHQEMEQLVLTLHDAGIAARHYVEFGPSAVIIAESAGFQHADLIVVAPHRRAWLETVRHSSMTLRLLRRSPAPLLIWPGEGPGKAYTNFLGLPTSCVIVPLDGSVLAERALPFAVNLAREYARPLMLVRAVPLATLAGPGSRASSCATRRASASRRRAISAPCAIGWPAAEPITPPARFYTARHGTRFRAWPRNTPAVSLS